MIAGLDLSKGKLAEWIFRLSVIVGLLFLSSNYVSIKDYKLDEARKFIAEQEKAKTLNEILITLARMDERSKNDDSKRRVEDLEKRMQVMEKKVP